MYKKLIWVRYVKIDKIVMSLEMGVIHSYIAIRVQNVRHI